MGKQKKEAFSMSIIPTPAQAMEWVRRYNQEEFHLHHAKTVGWVLGCLGARSAPLALEEQVQAAYEKRLADCKAKA